MAYNITLTILLSICICCLLLIHADDIKMQDTPAFQAALNINPCATACAITPSETFKTERCAETDLPDAAACICNNRVLSSQLASNISTYCYNNCGISLIPLATAILSDYCRINSARTTATEGSGGTMSTASATPGSRSETSVPVSTPAGTPSSSPTSSQTPEPSAHRDGGLSQESKISLGVGIGVGLPGAIAGCIAIWYGVLRLQRWSRNRSIPPSEDHIEVSRIQRRMPDQSDILASSGWCLNALNWLTTATSIGFIHLEASKGVDQVYDRPQAKRKP
ncbi:hypothetical protein B0O99DRAFT_38120 [Bisporella sp. PMI_857]|nr:hypothetical protein B0O99DRAFT_38120 [Bisporella sp. PMI_857]